MKGFYFSLDAILASSVMLSAFMMVSSQPTSMQERTDDYRLDLLYSSNLQGMEEWNESFNTNKNVLPYLAKQYYEGNSSKAKSVCESYFSIEPSYAIYIENKKQVKKLCGDINSSEITDVDSETISIPDFQTNNTFKGYSRATMVIGN